MMISLFRSGQSKKKQEQLKAQAEAQALAFEGLNPLLAKQLSELEFQIGQLAQVQFELSQERERMRTEMDALRNAVLIPAKQEATATIALNESSQ